MDIQLRELNFEIIFLGDDFNIELSDDPIILEFEHEEKETIEDNIEKFLLENLETLIKPFIPVLPEVKDGKTPKKGVDYFDGVDGVTPKKGIDYFTKKELSEMRKTIKEAILSEIPKIITEDEINVKFEDILKKIKNLPKGGGGALFLRQLMDVNVGTPTAQQYGLTYSPSRSEFALTPITGGGGAVDSVNGQTGVVVLDQDDIGDGTTYKQYSATEKTKLAGIETGAEVNTIDTVSDTSEIDLAITARDLTATIRAGSIDESKLDASVNASLDLADTALQSSAIGVSVQAYSSVLQNTTASFTTADETKLDNITVTQAVNLDTMESDIAAASVTINTQATILASTPTSETVAYATDTKQFYVFDGTNWQESSSYFGERNANPNMGAVQDGNANDIGRDFIANKRLSQIKLGGYSEELDSTFKSKGAIKGEDNEDTGDYEMSMWSTISQTWRRFLAGISLRNDTPNQTLVSDDFSYFTMDLFTGDSLEVDFYGTPMVQWGKISMGAIQPPVTLSGGQF